MISKYFILLFIFLNLKAETNFYEFSLEKDLKNLQDWSAEQFKLAKNTKVFYGFKFHDSLKESGIKFKHNIVPYVGKKYIPNHYDHGNGMAVADFNQDGLLDILFINQIGGNEIWMNAGGGKFKKSTFDSLVSLKKSVSVGVAIGDINNDGYPDIAISTVRDGVHLFLNNKGVGFTDISSNIDPNYNRHSSGLFFLDYNKDGKLDLFVTNTGVYTENKKDSDGLCYVGLDKSFEGHLYPERTEPSVLYENVGNNKFKDVSLKQNLFEPNWNGDGTFLDLDNDLTPEIYLSNMQGPNSYWVPDSNFKYKNLIQEVFGKTPWGAMSPIVLDYNNDGLDDLYVVDMHTDMFPPYSKTMKEMKTKMNNHKTLIDGFDKIVTHPESTFFGNGFYSKDKSNKFNEISDQLNLENWWPWGPSVEDINADGFIDIFITSGMSYWDTYGINWLYLNEHGKKFLNAEFLVGVEPRKELLTPWFKLDCDKVDKGHRNCENQKGNLNILAPKSSRSSVMFDIDNDGDLDIVTSDFNSAPQILISNLAQVKKINWLKIKLIGTKSNHDGLGSHLEIQTEKLIQYKYYNGKSGYMGQSSMPIYFGLGEDKIIKQIKVKWPSGVITNIKGPISSNQLINISESKGLGLK